MNAEPTRGSGRRPRAATSTRWLRVPVLVVVGLLLLTTALACAGAKPASEAAIVGNWVNAQGGAITFNADHTGSVPGSDKQTPPVPVSRFTYSLPDETHLALRMDGQDVVVEIKLEGDKMTWLSRANHIEYEYTRVK